MKTKDTLFVLAMSASIIVVGCIALAMSQVENWIPVAVIVGVAAALFTLIAYKLRKERDNGPD